MIDATWQPGSPGHARVSVPLEEAAEVEQTYAIGRRVNLFTDGWRPRRASAGRSA